MERGREWRRFQKEKYKRRKYKIARISRSRWFWPTLDVNGFPAGTSRWIYLIGDKDIFMSYRNIYASKYSPNSFGKYRTKKPSSNGLSTKTREGDKKLVDKFIEDEIYDMHREVRKGTTIYYKG